MWGEKVDGWKKKLFSWEEKLEGRKLNLYKFNIISLLNEKKVTDYIFIKKIVHDQMETLFIYL